MTVSTIHVLHSLVTPSNTYVGLEDATPNPTADILQAKASGDPHVGFVAGQGYKPEIVVRTHQVATLLSECGLTGADLSSGNTDLLYRKVVEKGTREATASLLHTRLRAADVYFYCQNLTAGHRTNAVGTARAVCLWDGTNDPIVPAGSQAISAAALSTEYFGLGPVSINGSELFGVNDFTLDFGAQPIEEGSASDEFDTFASAGEITPVITLRGGELSAWVSYGMRGSALTALTVYLRKKDADGTYVSDVTAEHVKITGSAGLVTVGSSSGGGNSPVQTEVRIYPRSASAGDDPIDFDTASAIT